MPRCEELLEQFSYLDDVLFNFREHGALHMLQIKSLEDQLRALLKTLAVEHNYFLRPTPDAKYVLSGADPIDQDDFISVMTKFVERCKGTAHFWTAVIALNEKPKADSPEERHQFGIRLQAIVENPLLSKALPVRMEVHERDKIQNHHINWLYTIGREAIEAFVKAKALQPAPSSSVENKVKAHP